MRLIERLSCYPKFIIYDDACHLQPFCESRIDGNKAKSLHFANKKFVVDKLHMKGHTGVECRRNNDTDTETDTNLSDSE